MKDIIHCICGAVLKLLGVLVVCKACMPNGYINKVTIGEKTFICAYIAPINWTSAGEYMMIPIEAKADKLTRIRVPQSWSSNIYSNDTLMQRISVTDEHGLGVGSGISIASMGILSYQRIFRQVKKWYDPTPTPTGAPTFAPSIAPIVSPTFSPTSPITTSPDINPLSMQPQEMEASRRLQGMDPTSFPVALPTSPTSSPSSAPSAQPTSIPSSSSTLTPSAQPTIQPTLQPSSQPTIFNTTGLPKLHYQHITFPLLFAIVLVDKGKIKSIAWDNFCSWCSSRTCASNTVNYDDELVFGEGGNCFIPDNECYVDIKDKGAIAGQTVNALCELSVYVSWHGTDSNGANFQSAAYRFSRWSDAQMKNFTSVLMDEAVKSVKV